MFFIDSHFFSAGIWSQSSRGGQTIEIRIKLSNVDVDRQLQIGVLMCFIVGNTRSTLALEPESTEICAKLSDTNGYTAECFILLVGCALIACMAVYKVGLLYMRDSL